MTVCRALLESLDHIPNEDNRTKISIITFDTALHHFFSMPSGSTEATMMAVSDIDDVLLPKPSDILVNLAEARASIEALLGRLGDMFQDSHVVGS